MTSGSSLSRVESTQDGAQVEPLTAEEAEAGRLLGQRDAQVDQRNERTRGLFLLLVLHLPNQVGWRDTIGGLVACFIRLFVLLVGVGVRLVAAKALEHARQATGGTVIGFGLFFGRAGRRGIGQSRSDEHQAGHHCRGSMREREESAETGRCGRAAVEHQGSCENERSCGRDGCTANRRTVAAARLA